MANSRWYATTTILAIVCLCAIADCRFLGETTTHNNVSYSLVSDGMDNHAMTGLGLTLEKEQLPKVSSTCEESYGFMPCTDTALGNLFLLVVYGAIMFQAASMLSDGSELLLSVMGPGIVGGLFLPILGALPDTLLIMVSGISGTKETAQEQVVVGMGLLAGSTVMLLTSLWGTCVIVGKCDLGHDQQAIDLQDNKKFLESVKGSGVTVDSSTRKASWIMMATIVPFIIAQIPLILNLKSAKHLSVLIASIVAFIFLLSYCIFQVLYPWVQKRHMAFLKFRHLMLAVVTSIHEKHLHKGQLIRRDSKTNKDVIDEGVLIKIFDELDANKDGHLSKAELRGLIVGLELQVGFSHDEVLDKVMNEFDIIPDDRITFKEFHIGLEKYAAMRDEIGGKLNAFMGESSEEGTEEGEEMEKVDNPSKVYTKAVFLLLGGALLAGIFADPLVDAVDNFSDATNIPSFFISFIAMPLATNSSEAISAILFALRKKQQTASLTFSEIYGGVTMNNTLCLGVFLLIVYLRGLDWNFSAEVLVILIAIAVMGIMGSLRTTYPVWMSFIAFLMYPFSLILVYVLDYQLGWS